MSGHSRWHKLRHKKAITDVKKAKIFSKLAREISVASREKGGDPETNPKLRLAIERAKQWNLPKENIERAIRQGTGQLPGEKLETFLFEAYGPGGIAIIIEGITDNKNRTLFEIKQILNQNNGKLVSEGSVKWLFERKGVITVSIANDQALITREELELKTIEAGAENFYWHDNIFDIYTKIEDLEKVKKNLENQGIKIESASLDWVAKEQIQVNEKEKIACQKLFAALDESEAVQEIYSNLKI